jgi:hypothetical protein
MDFRILTDSLSNLQPIQSIQRGAKRTNSSRSRRNVATVFWFLLVFFAIICIFIIVLSFVFSDSEEPEATRNSDTGDNPSEESMSVISVSFVKNGMHKSLGFSKDNILITNNYTSKETAGQWLVNEQKDELTNYLFATKQSSCISRLSTVTNRVVLGVPSIQYNAMCSGIHVDYSTGHIFCYLGTGGETKKYYIGLAGTRSSPVWVDVADYAQKFDVTQNPITGDAAALQLK